MTLLPADYVTWQLMLLAAVAGACAGSFVNCWAWRYVAGESILRGRSHCTSCGHALGVPDLVPVFSWLFSRGRCRHCGAKVSARYPATEVALGCVFALLLARYGVGVQWLQLALFSCGLLFLSLVDLDTFVIPNGTVLFCIGVRAVYLALACAAGECDLASVGYYVASAAGVLVALLAIVLVADRLFGRASMGGGDLKLFFVAGLYFGWQQCIFLVVVACVAGIAFALLAQGLPARDQVGPAAASPDSAAAPDATPDAADPAASPETQPGLLGRVIPFGPSIAFACVVCMLAGGPFVAWYLGLFL